MNFRPVAAGLSLGVAVGLGGMLYSSLSAQAQTQPATRTVWDGVYTQQQAARGRVLYNESCAVCHGSGLEGADVNPALVGGQFIGNWRGQSVGALVTRTRTTMPLDAPGSLSASAVTDITAYLLMRNRFPAGNADLPRTAQLQQRIQITERR